jgi:hypothetical protein
MIARIADAQAARAGSADAVSFGLRLGADSLTVRVELRDGAVRTQISTDAADLKSAIAGAWQGLTSATEGRSYHFAAPEFTGTGARRDDGGADSGAGNREPGRFQQSFTHREAPGRFAPDAEPETTAAAADSSNALRLHAVA